MIKQNKSRGTMTIKCDSFECKNIHEWFKVFYNEIENYRQMTRDLQARQWEIFAKNGTWHHLCPDHADQKTKL